MRNQRLRNLLAGLVLSVMGMQVYGFEEFIRVEGTRLMEGDKEFRFFSFNVPTLNYVEDEMQFHNSNPYGLPSDYELHDVFKTINELGGRVVRSYTIPVRNRNFPKESVTYVEAPGEFNEDAFKVMDKVIALARQYQIRLVIPLLNNWPWMGGRPDYAAFRGKTEDEFWTDRQLIEDFKLTIKYVLNRTNTITGIKYKDDPTIMAWETGNELQNPPEWGIEIARYIKSIDAKHILIDGFHAIHLEDYDVWVQQYSIDEPSIDMINTHHYEVSPGRMIENLKKTVAMIGGKKPVFLGEFGFISTTGIERVMDYIMDEPAIPGAFIWSLRRHHPDGGFYQHSEPVGYGLYRAYQWPGFNDGEVYDERNLLRMYREKAFEIQGVPVPDIQIPEAPELLPFSKAPVFSWRGSMGAASYQVERANSIKGPWQVIAQNIEDLDTPGFPLYSDETVELGHDYFYRIKAQNEAGLSAPSNVVGPVSIKWLTRVDKARNVGVLDESRGIHVATGDYRSYKEAFRRLEGEQGAWLQYHVPEKLREMRIYAYESSNSPALEIQGMTELKQPAKLDLSVSDFRSSESNYDYLIPRQYRISGPDIKLVRALLNAKASIVRVEIDYQ